MENRPTWQIPQTPNRIKIFKKHSLPATQNISEPHKPVRGQIIAIIECKAEHVRVFCPVKQ